MNISHASSPHCRPPLSAWRLLLSLGITLSALGTTARATNYYVDSSVASSGNGLSWTTPWKTIANVNSHGNFAAGDNIYFKRGLSYTGAGLVVNGSGTSDAARITYGSYSGNGVVPGTGAKPIIANAPGTAVTVTNRNYITISDLTINDPASSGVAINNGNFVTVLRVDVARNGGGPAISAIQGGNILYDGCTVADSASNGLIFKGSDTLPIHDSTIQNCVALRTITNDGIVIHTGGTPIGEAGANFVFRNNRSEDNFENGYDITTGSNILVENCISRNNAQGGFNIGHRADNVTLRYNLSENEPTGGTAQTLKITSPNVTLEYNVFIGFVGNPNPPVGSGKTPADYVKPVINIVNGTAGEPTPENIVIRNNTIIWNNPDFAGTVFSIGAGVPMQNLTLKNNIFASRTGQAAILNYAGVNPPNSAGFQIDNNLYYGSTATQWKVSGSNYTLATFQSTFNRDLNSWQGNPLFVNAGTGDFHLSSTASPAYNHGQNVGVAADFDGVVVPQNGARDIGAFEFWAPSSLTATAASSTQVNLSWPDVAGETGYRIQRKTGSGAFSDLVTKAANSTSHSDTTVSASTTYTYQIRAEDGPIVSAYTVSNPVTTPAGGGTGSLTGSVATVANGSSYNLATLGTSDWAHWNGTYIHKSTGGSQISNVTQIGGGTYGTFADTTRNINISWTGGTPTASGTNDHVAIWCNGTANSGWTFTVPATTTTKTLHVITGGAANASAKITAHLSDGSAADYTNTQTSTAVFTRDYTLTYKAASAGQTLTITLQHTNSGGPSCDLIAAWLQ